MPCRHCGETQMIMTATGRSYVCGYSKGYGPTTPCTGVDKVQQCPHCKTQRLTPGNHTIPFGCGFQFGNGVRAESPCGYVRFGKSPFTPNPCGEIPLEAINEVVQAVPDVCKCDLFMGGCTCGVFQREQAQMAKVKQMMEAN